MSVASLLWKDSASFPMPPVVENTNGVNVDFSTSMMRLLYVRFFSSSCLRYICGGVMVELDVDPG